MTQKQTKAAKTRLSTAERIARHVRRLKPSAFAKWLEDRPFHWRSNEGCSATSSLMEWLNEAVAIKFTKSYRLVLMFGNCCYVMMGQDKVRSCPLPEWMLEYQHNIQLLVKQREIADILRDYTKTVNRSNCCSKCYGVIDSIVKCLSEHLADGMFSVGSSCMAADKYECLRALDTTIKAQEQRI